MSISKSELTMGRETTYKSDYTREVSSNLDVLCNKINVIRTAYGKPMTVASGWRPRALNDLTANAAKNSKHITGLAVDIVDKDGQLWNWCMNNLQLISMLGLYLEDKRYTANWVHFGIGAPSSLKRIFKPNSKPAPYPHLWDGKYDSKWDGPEKD